MGLLSGGGGLVVRLCPGWWWRGFLLGGVALRAGWSVGLVGQCDFY